MSKSSEEGAANTPPHETASNNDKEANKNLYENRGSTKKIVRVLTVVAYVFSVSFAAIMLSAYYVFLWKPPNPRTIQGSPLLGESQAERLTSDWSEMFNVLRKHEAIQTNYEFGVGNEMERRFTTQSNGQTDGEVAGFDNSPTKTSDVTLSRTTTTTMTEPSMNNDESLGKTIHERPRNSDNSQITRNAVSLVSGNDSRLVSMIYGMNNNRTSRFLVVNADVNSPSESKKTGEEYSNDASEQQFPGTSTSVDDIEDMTHDGSSDDQIIDTTPVSSDWEHGTRDSQGTDSSTIQSRTPNNLAAMLNISSPTIPDYQNTSMSTTRR